MLSSRKTHNSNRLIWTLLLNFIKETPKFYFLFSVIIFTIVIVKSNDLTCRAIHDNIVLNKTNRFGNILHLFVLEVILSILQEVKYIIFLIIYGEHIRKISHKAFERVLSEENLADRDFENGTLQNNFHLGCNGITKLLAVLVLNVLPGIVGISVVIRKISSKFALKFVVFVIFMFIVFLALNLLLVGIEVRYRMKTNYFLALQKRNLYEILLNYENIRTLETSTYEIQRYDDKVNNYRQKITLYKLFDHLTVIVNRFLFSFVKLSVYLYLNSMEDADNELWKLFRNSLMAFERESLNMNKMYTKINKNLVDSMNIAKYFRVKVRGRKVAIHDFFREIKFKDVDIKNENNDFVIRNFNFTIKKGEKIALIGRNGSGKSTLLKAFMGLKEYEGQITIDGSMIERSTLLSFNQIAGYLSQNIVLFNETILYNILYGTVDKGLEDAIAICMRLNIHLSIKAKKQGYYATVGENGQFLSGGERQKILLARIILKCPRIFILDEPYAFLDKLSQVSLRDILFHEIPDCTMIMTVHDPKCLADFDKILHVSDSRISELKCHEEAQVILEDKNAMI